MVDRDEGLKISSISISDHPTNPSSVTTNSFTETMSTAIDDLRYHRYAEHILTLVMFVFMMMLICAIFYVGWEMTISLLVVYATFSLRYPNEILVLMSFRVMENLKMILKIPRLFSRLVKLPAIISGT